MCYYLIILFFLLLFLMKSRIIFNNGNTLEVNSINVLECHNAHMHPVILLLNVSTIIWGHIHGDNIWFTVEK